MKGITGYIRPYWKAAVAAPALMMLEVAMDLLQPMLMAAIIDKGVVARDPRYILEIGGIMVLVALVGAVGGVGCTYFSSIASLGFGSDLRLDLFKKVQGFSFSNLDNFQPASLITRLTNDVMQVQQMVQALLRILVRAPLLCVGGVAMALIINARLASILLLGMPVLGVALYYVISRGFPLFEIVQKRLDSVNAVMQENLSGVRVTKAFVRSDFEKERFAKANGALTDIGMRAGWLMGATNPVMILVMNASVIALLWFGARFVDTGSMHVGRIMALVNYVSQIFFSLMMVAFFFMNISRAKASADRIGQVLNEDIDIADLPGAGCEPVTHGRVEFRNVTFRYKGAGGEPVLRDISFMAEPGETIAILGSTGSGKSTLVNLIPRFYEATEGSILVDGRDVRDISLEALRQGIGVVLQESILFTGSIAANIGWGASGASDRDIREAAKAAQAHDFVNGFPEGYGTLVGQKGVNLSGGQKQRLSIARAILKRPRILILDDSTSAVDMGTEARLQAAMKELMADSTCFVIAQRVSTVLDADRILVLDDGRIAGIGKHSELMATCPVYQDIYGSQLGKEAM